MVCAQNSSKIGTFLEIGSFESNILHRGWYLVFHLCATIKKPTISLYTSNTQWNTQETINIDLVGAVFQFHELLRNDLTLFWVGGGGKNAPKRFFCSPRRTVFFYALSFFKFVSLSIIWVLLAKKNLRYLFYFGRKRSFVNRDWRKIVNRKFFLFKKERKIFNKC